MKPAAMLLQSDIKICCYNDCRITNVKRMGRNAFVGSITLFLLYLLADKEKFSKKKLPDIGIPEGHLCTFFFPNM